MIIDMLVTVAVALVTGLLGLIPEWNPMQSGFGLGLGSAVAGANSLFPAVALGQCILAVLGARMFIFTVQLVAWIWAQVPFTFK